MFVHMENPPKKILVIQTAFLGDVVLATAVLETLHQQFPETVLHFLVRKGNEGLLQSHPYLSEVLTWNKSEGKVKTLMALSQKIRKGQYDWVINLHRFASSGLLTAFSGAKRTTGFQKNPLSVLFTERYPHLIGSKEAPHEVERNHSLISRYTQGRFCPPRLYPTADDREKVAPYQTAPYVCIAPTSVWFTKQLPAKQWVALMQALPKDVNIHLLGAPSDRETCQQIADESGRNALNLAGKLSLLQSAALMEKATLNYVNDSGPMHLASAVDAPTCAVFCSTVPTFGFGPLASFSKVVQTEKPLSCRPCGLHGHKKCPEGHFQCATSIHTEQLLQVFREASKRNK